MLKKLEDIVFDNQFTRELPADNDTSHERRQVDSAAYTRIKPIVTSQPKLIAYSKEVAEALNISSESCESDLFTQVFTGNRVLEGMDPFAMCYGGHQFGNWAGQLGDGRAINLGETVHDNKRWMLQLKGAGPTPYSRMGDGFAVLRSSVREFLCSEAMFHLGVPTTRALSLALTGDGIVRDMFYDGNPEGEPGAVVCRVSPSFTRFGNFELPASRKDRDLLKKLVVYTIENDFPHLGEFSDASLLAWFEEICEKTLEMVLHWERVGFVHGVMNTDNMSILGLTIDYGPYGWLEGYDPNWTPNTTDAHGKRYAFGQQAKIAHWNLGCFAQAIFPLMPETEKYQAVLNKFVDNYKIGRNKMLASKIGLEVFEEKDAPLLEELLKVLQLIETDMTIFFRSLGDLTKDMTDKSSEELLSVISDAFYVPEDLTFEMKVQIDEWLRSLLQRWFEDERTDDVRKEKMNSVNPKYVLRNYLAQMAIERAEKDDFSLVHDLLNVLRRPYAEQPEKEDYYQKRPEWARVKPGCSMLSCSS